MSTPQLFIFSFTGLALLIVHSYFKRGFRLTLNFFLFAFMAGMRKEAGTFLGPPLSSMKYPTPFIHTGSYPLLFSVFNTTIGWMLAFYLSWCISDKIVERVHYFKGKIFPVLFFCGLVIAALSYSIEATAINIGWWKWLFFDKHFAEALIGGVHLFALSAWFYFAVHFLAPFFLIECSEFRNSEWRCIFFLIPFSRTCTMIFLGSGLPRMLHEFFIFIILITLIFVKPLDFNYPPFKIKSIMSSFLRKAIENIPFFVVFIVFSVLFFLDLIKIKDPSLLISLLPLVILILLAFRQLNPLFISVLVAVILLVFGKIGLTSLVPMLAFLSLLFMGRLLEKTETQL